MNGIVTVGIHYEAVLSINETCMRVALDNGAWIRVATTHVPCSIHLGVSRSSCSSLGDSGAAGSAAEEV